MDSFKLVKESYLRNTGSTFHMSREEPSMYELYRQLDPDESVLRGWDSELLESLFSKLWEDKDFVWGRFGQIIEVLNRDRVNIDYWASRLLDEMEKMHELDKRSKILIIEAMSGRTSREDAGGVHLICFNLL